MLAGKEGVKGLWLCALSAMKRLYYTSIAFAYSCLSVVSSKSICMHLWGASQLQHWLELGPRRLRASELRTLTSNCVKLGKEPMMFLTCLWRSFDSFRINLSPKRSPAFCYMYTSSHDHLCLQTVFKKLEISKLSTLHFVPRCNKTRRLFALHWS